MKHLELGQAVGKELIHQGLGSGRDAGGKLSFPKSSDLMLWGLLFPPRASIRR